jgi:hypothetical protein
LDLLVAVIGNAIWAINDQLKPIDNAINHQATDITKWLAIQNETIQTGFSDIVEAIGKLTIPASTPLKPLEVRFMFIVKNDHPSEPFSIVLGEVTDSEGNVIPDAQVDVAVKSSNEDAVSVSFDADSRSGEVSFGNAGVASLTAEVSSGGNLLGVGAVDFTVTLGDPAALSSIGINFPNLTEAPPAPEE